MRADFLVLFSRNKGDTFLQAMCLYYIGISNFCFDAVFCIMATHLAGQFRILRYRFMKLCDMDNEIHKKNSILEERMHKFHEKFKEYVRRHQALIDYHQKLENVYTTIMLGQVCNGVMEQSDNVAVGTYSALWTIMPMEKFGKMLRKDLIMVIMRSRRVCCLTANGFFPISLETYTKVYMQQNFWNVNYDHREKKILDDCRKTCIFFISCVTTMAICAMICYIMIPFIAQSGSNESERMLPFNMWINLPVSKTPYYEITFFIQATCVYYVGVSYFCFDNIFCIMAIHLAGQFRILRYRFTKLCDMEYENSPAILSKQMHKFYEKFRKCVQHHQALINFYQNLENVYTMITFGQVLATISFARRFIFVFMLNGSMFLLFMVTYSCNGVIEHSDNVAIGAYSALWMIMPMDKFGKILRKDLIMILSTALSYFTLLSNHIENST
ncbi:Odorant receptor Or2 [Apis cerana cerana]|uniref:Odorant receptor n=1 Tax=Apis cerana cerana TaxID=94128 RepID=A0A2A3E7A1_APICC|nr:Odorant receptor Or2 [Apis cerana cerana]